ncbi:MAG: hypothetical protein FJ190_08725 [Gammaproteobacteria bacterium]|nr:hypothetical protein [Gammaproteobacteria bacterium]
MPTLIQWQTTWQTLGAPQAPIFTELYQALISKYSENHRHYHNLQHLTECLEKFAELRHLAVNPAEIELALWFHDAIYDPVRHDNEQLSAEWAKASSLAAGVNPAIAGRVFQLIMATRHLDEASDADTNILLDCDLAILGANPKHFFEYERQIHQEYAFVPEAIFRQKRAEILQRFLAQPAIFNTVLFVERYEQQARINLQQAMERLCPMSLN